MKYHPRDIERLSKNIMEEIAGEIEKSGIFYRIFFRCKGSKSLERKLQTKNENGNSKYDGKNKLLRDIIGIRINLYFIDDLELITDFFKKKLAKYYVEETIDKNNATEFKPTRVNIIFKIANQYKREFLEVVTDKRIDPTFELQLRTVLSEGWHEVEHDLRYKCQKDWAPYPEMSRMFNGFLAALETQEWSMVQLFERISYEHYKKENISALIRTKLRIRFDDLNITEDLLTLLKKDESFLRDFFKMDRITIIRFLLHNKLLFPLTIDNIIYLVNFIFIKNKNLISATPDFIKNALKEYTIKADEHLDEKQVQLV